MPAAGPDASSDRVGVHEDHDGTEDDRAMRPGTSPHPARRTWTVEIRPQPGGPVLDCPQCGPLPHSPTSRGARTAALEHLADHARREVRAPHLRTCQCGQQECCWHPRHRGCNGPVLLLLTRTAGGRTWRLADTCHACATATAHAAVVSEEPPRPRTAARQQRPAPALLWTTDGVSPDEEAPPWVEEALYD